MKKLRKILSVKGQSCQNIHDQLIYNRLENERIWPFFKEFKNNCKFYKEKKERGNDNKCLSNIGAKSNSSVPEPLRFSTVE